MTCYMQGRIVGAVSDCREGDAPHYSIKALNERGDEVVLFFDSRTQALDFAMKLSFAILQTPEDKGEKNDPQSK